VDGVAGKVEDRVLQRGRVRVSGGRKVRHSWRGDLHFGRLVTKNRLVQLVAEPDRLILTGSRHRYELPRSEILSIVQANGGFWKWRWPIANAVGIEHRVEGCPKKLVFRCADTTATQVLLVLEVLEFPV